jgi:hypothetical protein
MSDREDLEFAHRIAEPLRAAEPAEPDFEARILTAVRAAAERGEAPWSRTRAARRSWEWMVTPRRIAVAPLAGLALAAGFAALVAATTLALGDERRTPETVQGTAESGQVVQFAIAAPNASAVALVGDFNGWDTKTIPMARGAVEGLWTVTVPLAAGSYQYAFVIDGTTWTADPAAPIALEDEFGAPSSVVRIGGDRT